MSVALVRTRSPQDPSPSTVSYRGDITPPVTSYAYSGSGSAFGRPMPFAATPARKIGTGAVVVRGNRMNGMQFHYGYGPERMPLPQVYPGGNDGQVRISAFQQYKNHLFDFVINKGLYQAGFPRNLGLSYRTEQLKTNVTGGPWKSRMQARPQFTKVQTIGRYSTVPQAYKTKAAKA